MNINLFKLAEKNIKILAIVAIVAGVLSILFSSATFIAPKFKSLAIVYPSNLGEYSEESPIEQMMQWFESREIMDNVIEQNNLAEHYEIKMDDKLSSYYLIEEYKENISIKETKYESAEISVIDTDPETAFNVVNSIISNFNKVIRAVHKKRAAEDLKVAEERFNKVASELDSVSRELKKIRMEYNIIDYAALSKEVTRGYLRTIEGANKSNINIQEIIRLKENIEKKGGDFILYDQRIYALIEDFQIWENKYYESLSNVKREMTYTNIVSEAQIPVKKVYPVRWLIVLVSTFGAVAFAFILLLYFDRIKNSK